MKLTKKLLALVMAMVMTFSLMAVTAAAYGAEEHEHVCSTETIQPRTPAYMCHYCGEGLTLITQRGDADGHHYGTFKCTNRACTNFDKPVYYDWWL